jgi:hypothetical protein
MVNQGEIKQSIVSLLNQVWYNTEYSSVASKQDAFATGLTNIIVNAIKSANVLIGVPTEIGGITLPSGRNGDLI